MDLMEWFRSELGRDFVSSSHVCDHDSFGYDPNRKKNQI